MSVKTLIFVGALSVSILAGFSTCQEQPEDWPSSYNIGPYKHVYPPTNLSIDQLSCVPDISANKTCPLFIQLIMSFGGSYTSSGVIPGIQVALDQINASPNLLLGYTLHYTLLDSQCDETTSLTALHAGLFEPPTKIAVIGSGCSIATEVASQVSHFYNISQLSCASSSTELLNRRRYARHFQMCTADISLAYGFFGIIRNANWRKVTIVVENEPLFTTTMDELKRLLLATNVSFDEIRYQPNANPFTADSDARIFVLSMYENFARQTLCQAYNMSINFRYPRVQFLINGWYTENWWEGSKEEQEILNKKFGCSVEQRRSLVPYVIGVSATGKEVVNYSIQADNGFTGDDIRSSYNEYLKASFLNITELYLYQLCYDTTWTLARALNNTLNDLKNDATFRDRANLLNQVPSADIGLQHFTYENSILGENIFRHLSKTNISGIVGDIVFTENGSRLTDTVEVIQFRYLDNSSTIIPFDVGIVYRINDLEYQVIYGNGTSFIWPNGVPYDGVATNRIVSIHLSITIIFSVLAACGIVLAVVFLILNIRNRNTKIVRLTSPYLNCLIVLGAIVLYVNIFLYVAPSTNKTTVTWLCNVDSWLTAIGYSLCYGTILFKMLRVYYIFHNPTTKKKKALKDWILAVFVGLLIAIDAVIIVTSSLVEGLTGQINTKTNLLPNRENPEDVVGAMEVTFRYFAYVCNSRNRFITLGVLYGYKALLQIIAIILAVSIRKVKIKGLNDAIYIIAAIYMSSIVTSVIVVSTYALVEFVNVYAVVISACLFVGTTVILFLVFVPPLVNLHKDPDGSSVFKKTGGMSMPSMDNDTITSLRKRIVDLENRLQEQNRRVSTT